MKLGTTGIFTDLHGQPPCALEQSSVLVGVCFEITIKDYSGFRVLMGKDLDDNSGCEETDSKSKRFFKSQTAFDGNCSINDTQSKCPIAPRSMSVVLASRWYHRRVAS